MANGADRRLFWGTAAAVVVADVVTKLLAESLLARHLPVQVLGDYVQLRLVYNQCAAFGLCLGAYSRWIFFGLAIAALFVLRSMVRSARPRDRFRLVSPASSPISSRCPAPSPPASSPPNASPATACRSAPRPGWNAGRW